MADSYGVGTGRIRTIKPEMATHELLFDIEIELGINVRFAWAMLFCQCDREGRFPWRPRMLKARILPFDACDFSRVLDAWATRGLVVHYVSDDGAEYGWIPTFTKHQQINNRERDSSLPDPENCRVIRHIDACPTRAPRDGDASRRASARAPGGTEGNGRERKGTEVSDPDGSSVGPPDGEPDATASPNSDDAESMAGSRASGSPGIVTRHERNPDTSPAEPNAPGDSDRWDESVEGAPLPPARDKDERDSKTRSAKASTKRAGSLSPKQLAETALTRIREERLVKDPTKVNGAGLKATAFVRWSAPHKDLIARLKDGAAVEDVVLVVAFKCAEWGHDSKMRKYIRQETLFRPSHWVGYLDEARDWDEDRRGGDGNGGPENGGASPVVEFVRCGSCGKDYPEMVMTDTPDWKAYRCASCGKPADPWGRTRAQV